MAFAFSINIPPLTGFQPIEEYCGHFSVQILVALDIPVRSNLRLTVQLDSQPVYAGRRFCGQECPRAAVNAYRLKSGKRRFEAGAKMWEDGGSLGRLWLALGPVRRCYIGLNTIKFIALPR